MSISLLNACCYHSFVVVVVSLFICYHGVHVQSITDYTEKGCQELPDGVYPLRNLSQFMVCDNKQTVNVSSCRPMEIYSTNNTACVPLKNITEETFCENRPTGDWMYIWDCHKYFHCYFNWYKVGDCDNSTVYDATQDICTAESESTCMVYNLTKSSGNHESQSPSNSTVEPTMTTGNIISTNSTNTTLTLTSPTARFTTTVLPATENSPRTTASPTTTHPSKISLLITTTLHPTLAKATEDLGSRNPLTSGNLTSGNISSGNLTSGNLTSNSTTNKPPNATNFSEDSTKDLISPSGLQTKLAQNESIILIDVRMPWELKVEGKIGISTNIPLPQIKDAFQLNDDTFASKFAIKKPKKDDCNLVFHCKTGVRSKQAVEIVKSLGYTCPKSLDGGFEAWKKIYQK